jgi:uncharacterized protein (DUF983 family)
MSQRPDRVYLRGIGPEIGLAADLNQTNELRFFEYLSLKPFAWELMMKVVQASFPDARDLSQPRSTPNARNVWQSLGRGLRGRCPQCGQGAIFYRYLKVNDNCPVCHEELFHQRADDAPPYMTIFIVAHIVVALMLLVEDTWPDAPILLHMVIWPLLTIILSLTFLPRIKGALIAYQWALRMHGFADAAAG